MTRRDTARVIEGAGLKPGTCSRCSGVFVDDQINSEGICWYCQNEQWHDDDIIEIEDRPHVVNQYAVDFHGHTLDVYRIAELYTLPYPLAHAVKKIVLCGRRGEKSARQDLEEAKLSLDRMIEMWDEDEA